MQAEADRRAGANGCDFIIPQKELTFAFVAETEPLNAVHHAVGLSVLLMRRERKKN